MEILNEPTYLLTVIGILILLLALVLYLRTPKRSLPPQEISKPTTEAPVVVEPAAKKDLSSIFSETRDAFWGKLKGIFENASSQYLDDIEEILYTSDLGPKTVQKLMDGVKDKLSKSELSSFEVLRSTLSQEMKDIIEPVHRDVQDLLNGQLENPGIKTKVWLIVGVNGAGKTTTIGKLAGLANSKNKKVLVAAGDTFRAAAASQLNVWSKRAQVEIFEAEGKPSGVAFDAVQKAVKENFDLVLVDTAGRLHTQTNLMEELKKIKRVIEKALPGAPHETLLVLDANNGQNALVQAQQFHSALNVTGVILTKLDGTAKGGVVVGLSYELGLPIRAIGVGEKIEDLRSFDAKEFVKSII